MRSIRELISPQVMSANLRFRIPSLFETAFSGVRLPPPRGAVCSGLGRVGHRIKPFAAAPAADENKLPSFECKWPDSPDNCVPNHFVLRSIGQMLLASASLGEGLNSLKNQPGGLVCVSALPGESGPGSCYSVSQHQNIILIKNLSAPNSSLYLRLFLSLITAKLFQSHFFYIRPICLHSSPLMGPTQEQNREKTFNGM